jgi:hypothetical protein
MARLPARAPYLSKKEKTAFDKGVDSVSWLLVRFMLVMVPAVFLINGFTKHDWLSGLSFRDFRRGGPHPGNAADDRDLLPRQRGDHDGQKESHRQKHQLDSKLRRHGCSLHR